MRTTPAELVAHHKPGLAIDGTRVTVTFRDQGVARAYFDGIFQAGDRRRAPDDPTRMIGKRLDSLTLETGQPLEGWADLFLRVGDGQTHHFILDPSDLANIADGVRSDATISADVARENDALHLRIKNLEQECARLREPAGRPDLRDMGATLVDKARARLLEAKADRLEKDTAAEYTAPADPGPLAARSVSVDNEQRRPGERVLWLSFSDGAGRDVRVGVPFALALKLNSGIGHAVADRIDAAGER